MLRKYFCLTFLIFFSAKNLIAQWEPPYLYHTFSGDTSIQCMDATDGYLISNTTLWVGTNKGVFAIKDNSETIFYDSTNSSLPSNEITAIDVDNDQQLVWIGTNHGICRPGDTSWTCFSTSTSSLPSDSITCILAFHLDSVWIGTKSGLVLYLANTDTFILFDQSNSALPSNHVQCLERRYFIPYSYHPEPLYVGTDSGMVIINGGQWSFFGKSNSGLQSDDIRSIAIGFAYYLFPNIWVATYGGGVNHLFDTTWISFTTSNSLIKTDSLDFIEDVFDIVCGSQSDSLYVQNFFSFDSSFSVFENISYPIASASLHRGNGCWLWVANDHEIYRADLTEGIFDPVNSKPSWQAAINGSYLHLFKLPSNNNSFGMKIQDVLGKTVFQNQFSSHQSASMSFTIPPLPQGIYLVELQYPDHHETVKVVKTE